MKIIMMVLAALLVAGCQPGVQIASFDDCVKAGNPVMESYPRQCRAGDQTFTEQVIGGDRDQNGCLISAGYAYDPEVGACIRSFELDESQKKAAALAAAPYSMGVTVVSVLTERCPGCFAVELERNDNGERIKVQLNDWKIGTGMPALERYCTEEEKAAEICTADYDPVCGNDGETYGNACSACAFGKVTSYTGGECPLPTRPELIFCTEEQKRAQMCTMDYTPVCGNDGVTYGNACAACASGEVEAYAMGECIDTEDRHICTADEKERQACTKEYMPVCGDDGITYGNACMACASPSVKSYAREECPPLIGGDTDEMGCMVAAGYSWSEDVRACIRTWELSAEERKAAGIAADAFPGIMTVISVEYLGSAGSYKVTLQDKDFARSEVTIRDWDVESVG